MHQPDRARRAEPLPSLNALLAFEVAARHSSFTRAAAELGVTQTAISHQVRALENELGTTLFRRSPQRISLTPEGLVVVAFRDWIISEAGSLRERTLVRARTAALP